MLLFFLFSSWFPRASLFKWRTMCTIISIFLFSIMSYNTANNPLRLLFLNGKPATWRGSAAKQNGSSFSILKLCLQWITRSTIYLQRLLQDRVGVPWWDKQMPTRCVSFFFFKTTSCFNKVSISKFSFHFHRDTSCSAWGTMKWKLVASADCWGICCLTFCYSCLGFRQKYTDLSIHPSSSSHQGQFRVSINLYMAKHDSTEPLGSSHLN